MATKNDASLLAQTTNPFTSNMATNEPVTPLQPSIQNVNQSQADPQRSTVSPLIVSLDEQNKTGAASLGNGTTDKQPGNAIAPEKTDNQYSQSKAEPAPVERVIEKQIVVQSEQVDLFATNSTSPSSEPVEQTSSNYGNSGAGPNLPKGQK